MQNRNSFWTTIPAVTKNLLIINLIVWLADLVIESRFKVHLINWFGLYYIGSGAFHWWQPFTYMFMHANFGHLFCNMFAVFMFATPLEQQWGSKRFLIYYIISGIGAGITQEIVWGLMYGHAAAMAVTIGASGAVFGILFAFGWLFPETRLFIFPFPIPIKARIFVIIYAFIELLAGLGNFSGDNVAHFAHLGGLLFGWLLILCWKRFDRNFGATPSNFNIKQWWEKVKKKFKNHRKENNPHEGYHYQRPVDDNEGDASKQDIDEILDKIRKSGYDSLTAEEKEKLFKK